MHQINKPTLAALKGSENPIAISCLHEHILLVLPPSELGGSVRQRPIDRKRRESIVPITILATDESARSQA